MAVSNRIRAALTTTALATAATGFMSGCAADAEEEEQRAYCVDENGEIVDEDLCDDGYDGPGAGFFFLYYGAFRGGLSPGTVLPPGGTRIDPRDSAARRSAGLPGTGKVGQGTRVTGGIGSGLGGRSGVGAGS